MLCLSRPPSHCDSDGAVLTPPHHSPVCCHLSHQGTPQPPLLHTTWTAPPPLISTLSRVLFVCDELVHLTVMTVFLSHPIPYSLSLTPARPSPFSPLPLLLSTDPFIPYIQSFSTARVFPLLSNHPLGLPTHSVFVDVTTAAAVAGMTVSVLSAKEEQKSKGRSSLGLDRSVCQ